MFYTAKEASGFSLNLIIQQVAYYALSFLLLLEKEKIPKPKTQIRGLICILPIQTSYLCFHNGRITLLLRRLLTTLGRLGGSFSRLWPVSPWSQAHAHVRVDDRLTDPTIPVTRLALL